SGASREEMYAFAEMIGKADKAVFVWSMGITQHECGEENVKAIINLALTKGFVGREGCGLMPIRGHSGVQGGAEMGCYATVFPGGRKITPENAEEMSKLWGFEVPTTKGLITSEAIDAAAENKLDFLFSVGGNFIDVLPDPDYVESALSNIPLRVHMDIMINQQMFLEPGETVLLLPATTRYEIPGGVTETSTERRVIFSPEIPGRRIGEARPEWQVLMELARRVRPEIADKLSWDNTAQMRQEIALVIPSYAGIQNLKEAGDQFQYGGSHLAFGWNFATPDSKANFAVLSPQTKEIPAGHFLVATRRGKQFNSMVQEQKDQITGAIREAVLINQNDAEKLGLNQGDRVILKNDLGEYKGKVYTAPIKPGNLQIHWPEGNILLDKSKRSAEGVPDYNALVTLEKV
ncbi:MAG: molybdopterin-dependent oxidoreductase, partial [Xenococcaceae cyanobacterium MO_188.B29]|nr:molybdopterin-dependent oxidoreductase [Xenococcaceae cyanobacterium MO_188.B29]